MNAAEQARSLELAQLIASVVTLFRQRCPCLLYTSDAADE